MSKQRRRFTTERMQETVDCAGTAGKVSVEWRRSWARSSTAVDLLAE